MMANCSNYSSLSCQELANALTLQNVTGMCKNILLIDVRPSAQHCSKHIATSENVNFSSILLRRLSKGVADLKSLLHYDQTLHDSITNRNSEQELLVLYDSCSTKSSLRTDLVRHGDVLARTKHGRGSDCKVYYLDGGFEAFSATYPQHCVSSTTSKKAHSPLGISVSASLPIFSVNVKATPTQKLCTPSEDSTSHFGPPVQILPHLVLGAAKDSSNLTQLRKMGVTAVLNVSNNCPNHFESVLEYKCIAVEDSYQADLLSKMENAIEFIDSVKAKGGCVFVHCHAGISRSATISISYIMKTMGWELSKAYEFVKHKRPCISPNLHFMGQLLEFEKLLKEQRGDLLGSDAANSVDGPSPFVSSYKASSPFQPIPVPKHLNSPIMEECKDFFCSSGSAIPSASAPSSLHCEQTEQDTSIPSVQAQTSIMERSAETKITPPKPKNLPLFGCQSFLSGESDPRILFQIGSLVNENEASQQQKSAIRKPTSLPLLQVKSHSSRHTGSESSTHRLLRQRSTPVQSAASLPTTPDNHFRNNTLSSSSSSVSSACSSVRLAPQSHQNSPCRVEALLGSGSESPLNFSCNGELSL